MMESDQSQNYKGKVVAVLKLYFPNGVPPEEFGVMLETLIDIGDHVEKSFCFGEGLMTIH